MAGRGGAGTRGKGRSSRSPVGWSGSPSARTAGIPSRTLCARPAPESPSEIPHARFSEHLSTSAWHFRTRELPILSLRSTLTPASSRLSPLCEPPPFVRALSGRYKAGDVRNCVRGFDGKARTPAIPLRRVGDACAAAAAARRHGESEFITLTPLLTGGAVSLCGAPAAPVRPSAGRNRPVQPGGHQGSLAGVVRLPSLLRPVPRRFALQQGGRSIAVLQHRRLERLELTLVVLCRPEPTAPRRAGLAVSGLEPRPLPSALVQLGLIPVGRVAGHMSPLLTLPVASLACRLLEKDTGSCAALSIAMMVASAADASTQVMSEARAVLESTEATVTATVLAIAAVWGTVASVTAAAVLVALFVRGEAMRAWGDVRGYLRQALLLPEGEAPSPHQPPGWRPPTAPRSRSGVANAAPCRGCRLRRGGAAPAWGGCPAAWAPGQEAQQAGACPEGQRSGGRRARVQG